MLSAWLCGRLQASSGTEKWLGLKADHTLICSICAWLCLCVYIHMYQILINTIRQWSELTCQAITGLLSGLSSAVVFMNVRSMSYVITCV